MATIRNKISLDSIPANLRRIMARFLQNGFEVWVVGGALRDLLLGRNPKDWDLATSASPKQVIDLFPRVIPLGLRHGTVQIHCDHETIEVTSCPSGGAEGIHADLQRRDFTANALAFSYPDGQLIDPFRGQKDILSRTLRSVGDPGLRFAEDPLRTLRAGRFLSVYGFNVEPDTFAAIRKAAPGLQGVSRERIREEFFKMLLGKHFPVAFNDMMRGRVIQQFLPELAAQQTAERTDSPQRHAAVFGRKQIITTEATENAERMQREPLQSDMTADRYGRCQELIEHSVNAVRHSPPRLTVRLAALFHHLGDLDLEQIGESSLEPLRRFRESALTAAAIMKRLRASRCLEKEVAFLVENQISEDSENWTQGDLRCFLATVDEGRLEDAMDLASADGKARRDGTHRLMTLRNLRLRISRELKRRPPLRIADLAVSGWDVMRVLNLEPGPAVGEVIRRLHRVVLEDPALNHRKILMDFLKKEYHIESRTDNGRHE